LAKKLVQKKILIEVALGEQHADQVIRNGHLLNVYTGEILEENVALWEDRIAYVGTSERMIGRKTRVWEAEGKILVPGYMDPHCHPDLFYNPAAFTTEAVMTGTTSVFSDMHDLSNALGLAGILQVLQDAPRYPLTFYFGVPSSAPPFPRWEGGEKFSLTELQGLLKRPEALGLSEVTAFMRILRKDPRMLKLLLQARRLGKTAEGHTIGVNQEKLNALVGAGLTSCHESLTAGDVLKRLRLGLYVMLRGGSIRNDLPELCRAVRRLSPYDTSRIMLTPDSLFPEEMARSGYLDHLLRQVLDLGVEPVKAYQMTTLNPARYFGLEQEQGAIAPGRRADILLLNDLKDPRPVGVMAKGKWVQRAGKRIAAPAPPFPAGAYDHPFDLPPVTPGFFYFQAPHQDLVPVIKIDDRTVTRRVDRKVQDQTGIVRADPHEDLAKVALIQRQGKQAALGLVTGFGARLGAISSTMAHETHNILVLGFDDRDMARAVNEVVKMGGGLVIVRQGKVLGRLGLPVGGLMSTRPVPDLAREIRRFVRVLRELGSTLEDPILTLSFLSFTSLIELRITLSGIYEVKTGKILYNAIRS
jgi:adenine deaminase